MSKNLRQLTNFFLGLLIFSWGFFHLLNNNWFNQQHFQITKQEKAKEGNREIYFEQNAAIHESGHLLSKMLHEEKLKSDNIEIKLIKPTEIKIRNVVNKKTLQIQKNNDGSNQRNGYVYNKYFANYQNYLKSLSIQKQIIVWETVLRDIYAGYLSTKIIRKKFTYQQGDVLKIIKDLSRLLFKLHCEKLSSPANWCQGLKENAIWNFLEFANYLIWTSETLKKNLIWNFPFNLQARQETETMIKQNQEKLISLAELVWNVKFLQEEEIEIVALLLKQKNWSWPENFARIINSNKEKNWYLKEKNYFPQTERAWQFLEKKLTSSQTDKTWEEDERLTDLLPMMKEEIILQGKANSEATLEKSSYDSFIRKVVNQEAAALKAWKQLVALVNYQPMKPTIKPEEEPINQKEETTDQGKNNLILTLSLVGGFFLFMIIMTFLSGRN